MVGRTLRCPFLLSHNSNLLWLLLFDFLLEKSLGLLSDYIALFLKGLCWVLLGFWKKLRPLGVVESPPHPAAPRRCLGASSFPVYMSHSTSHCFLNPPGATLALRLGSFALCLERSPSPPASEPLPIFNPGGVGSGAMTLPGVFPRSPGGTVFLSVHQGIFHFYHVRLLRSMHIFMARVGLFIKTNNVLFILTVLWMMQFTRALLEPGCPLLSTSCATSWWVNLAVLPFTERVWNEAWFVHSTCFGYYCYLYMPRVGQVPDT